MSSLHATARPMAHCLKLTSIVFFTGLLQACSTIPATENSIRDLSVLKVGTPRKEVVAELLQPVKMEIDWDGNEVDVYYFIQGLSVSERRDQKKRARAQVRKRITTALASVGVSELARPRKRPDQPGKAIHLRVVYDENILLKYASRLKDNKWTVIPDPQLSEQQIKELQRRYDEDQYAKDRSALDSHWWNLITRQQVSDQFRQDMRTAQRNITWSNTAHPRHQSNARRGARTSTSDSAPKDKRLDRWPRIQRWVAKREQRRNENRPPPPNEEIGKPPQHDIRIPPRDYSRVPTRNKIYVPPRNNNPVPTRNKIYTPPRNNNPVPPRSKIYTPPRNNNPVPTRNKIYTPPRNNNPVPTRNKIYIPPRNNNPVPTRNRIYIPPRN